jgi:hypothetical protein
VAIMKQLMTEDSDAFADHVEGVFSVNPNRPAIDRCNDLKGGHPSIFESQTGYTFSERDEFARRVVPELISCARSTGIQNIRSGRPPKLTPEQRLLSCDMYRRKRQGTHDAAVTWNWSRSVAYDDFMFVCTLINESLSAELQWPDASERFRLGSIEPMFHGCVSFIDGTLVRIYRPALGKILSSRYYTRRKTCTSDI